MPSPLQTAVMTLREYERTGGDDNWFRWSEMFDAMYAALDAELSMDGKPNESEPVANPIANHLENSGSPEAYIYEVRFTDPPDSEWRYYGIYRSKAQVESTLDRTTDDDIEGRIVPLYRRPSHD